MGIRMEHREMLRVYVFPIIYIYTYIYATKCFAWFIMKDHILWIG